MDASNLDLDTAGPARASRSILVYRLLVLVISLLVLVLLTIRVQPGADRLLPAGIAFLFIAFQTLFPLRRFSRESTLAHLTALGAGLLFGPVTAGWAVVFGIAAGWGARRSLGGKPRPAWLQPPAGPLETSFEGGAVLLSLAVSALLVELSVDNQAAGRSATLLFTITLIVLLCTEELILSRTMGMQVAQRLRSSFADLFWWYILPAPFVLLAASLSPETLLEPLLLIGAVSLTLSVLLFRQDKLRADASKRNRELESLRSFSAQASTSLDEGDVSSDLCELAAGLSGAAGSAVYLHHLEDGTVRLKAAHRLSEQLTAEIHSTLFSLKPRMQALITGRPTIVPDIAVGNADEDYRQMLRREGFQAYGDFPLISPDGPIGYLSVYFSHSHRFESQEIERLETLCALAALSTLTSRLHGRTDLALSRRIHQLSILETVGRELAVAIQSERLFDLVLDYAVDFTDASWGSICLLSPNGQQMTVKATRGYASFPGQLQVKDGLPGKAARMQQAVNSADTGAEQENIDYTGGMARSHLSVPLLHSSNVLGVISLESARPEAFTRADELFLQQLASQAAVALELYQSIQTRELITETLVHDIRSPISAALGALEVIDETLPDSIGEKGKIIRQATQVSRQAAFRVLRLIESLLDIARFQSGKIEIYPEFIPLRALVHEVLGGFAAQAAEYDVEMCNDVPEELPDLYADRGKINRVIYNLIDNALKFSPSSSRITATARLYDGENVLVQVIDKGPGIPEEYRERIFERFSQIPGISARRRGTGLGLTFCRLAVEAHGGRIWVESGGAGGSVFNLTLPCRASAGI